MRITFALLSLALVAGSTSRAHADDEETWLLTLEPGFTLFLNEPQSDQFHPGVSFAAGVYRSFSPWFLAGIKLRASVFGSDDPPADPTWEDQPAGGLYTLSAALRFRFWRQDDPRRAVGPFIDLVGGPGLTDSIVRGTVEGGFGWGFEAGSAGISPVVRYQHVFHDDPIDNGVLQSDDAYILILGLEVALLDNRPVENLMVEPRDPCAELEEDIDGFMDDDGCPDPDNDGDGILDVDDACPNVPETFNGFNDHDGCPDQPAVEVVDDRLVVEEHVFFDFDQSDLREGAGETIQAIVALWAQHPGWQGIQIGGHTDNRGTREYNLDLSNRRVASVRAALEHAGMNPDRISGEGHGEMEPLVHGTDLSEREHQRNRRVEFLVVRGDGTEVPADVAAEEIQAVDPRPDPNPSATPTPATPQSTEDAQ